VNTFVPFADRRLTMVDAMRGAAGLVFVLITGVSGALRSAAAGEGASPLTVYWLGVGLERFVAFSVLPLFSLLFGFGLAIQLERAAQRQDTGVRWRLVRRHLALVVFGALHVSVVGAPDVLTAFGCLGFVLVQFTKLGDRKLAMVGVFVWAVSAFAWFVLLLATGFLAAKVPDLDRLLADAAAPVSLLRHSPRAIVGASFEELRVQAESPASAAPVCLAMALGGLALARARWLHEVEDHVGDWQHLRRWCIGVSLVGAALVLSGELAFEQDSIAAALHVFGLAIVGPACCLALVATVALHSREGRWPLLANVGRMSLSVYLLQSLIFSAQGPATRVGAVLGALASLVVALVFVGLLLSAARVWFLRFKFGPGEWLLRSLTYGRMLRCLQTIRQL
jgi:uncharacterized protein